MVSTNSSLKCLGVSHICISMTKTTTKLDPRTLQVYLYWLLSNKEKVQTLSPIFQNILHIHGCFVEKQPFCLRPDLQWEPLLEDKSPILMNPPDLDLPCDIFLPFHPLGISETQLEEKIPVNTITTLLQVYSRKKSHPLGTELFTSLNLPSSPHIDQPI